MTDTGKLQVWNEKVFGQYLPNSFLYRSSAVTKSFVPGKHFAFSFTHELAKGTTMEMAKESAAIILHVLQEGNAPPVTEKHAERIIKGNLPPGEIFCDFGS